jgi:hypothetical protein
MQNSLVCAIRFSLSFPAKTLFISTLSLTREHLVQATISHPANANRPIPHEHFQDLSDDKGVAQ